MIARLNIKAASRDGQTYLKNSFYSPPFKLANITEDKKSKLLQLMLMSSSPGILDNDQYNIQIELNEQACVELETQSYQRLYQMRTGARQDLELTMAPYSSFVFLPHPVVPHQSSVFLSKSKIYLSKGCKLIWGEVLTCGRKLNGEIFRFSKYQSITEIFLADKMIVKENLVVYPTQMDMHAMGQMEGYTHQASLICFGFEPPVHEVIEDIHELLLHEKDLCAGISALQVHGCIVRLLGYRAEQLHHCLQKIASHVRITVNKNEPVKTVVYAG